MSPNAWLLKKTGKLLKQSRGQKIKQCKYWASRVHKKQLIRKESKVNKSKRHINNRQLLVCVWSTEKQPTKHFQCFFLILYTQLHKHITTKKRLTVPNVKTTSYGSNCITLKTIKQWNKIQIFVNIDIYSPYIESQ